MKAVILAAGVGSRLRPITERKPKCLTKVFGRPILEHQINALSSAGVDEVIIVTGYMSEKVEEFLKTMHYKKDHLSVNVVRNLDYEFTNNMYSLYLTSERVYGHPFLLLNGDVVIEPEVARRLVQDSRGDLIAVDRSVFFEESMKVKVDDEGFIVDISKGITRDEYYATSIDFYKFSRDSGKVFLDFVRKIIEEEKNLKDWTEVAMQRLFIERKLRMKPLDISGLKWIEIDNLEDLTLAHRIFSKVNLKNKKAFFFDMDGTVYMGNTPIPGAREAIEAVSSKGKFVYFISNNSSRSKKDYVKKLSRMGIKASEDQIILSTDGAVEYLKSIDVSKIYVLGTSSMKELLVSEGFEVDEKRPEYVVVGYDTELTYEKLAKACLLISKGVPYIATHMDIVCPTENGNVPDIGSILAAIETATGKRPEKIFGKPRKEMVDKVMKEKGLSPDEVVFIGDRLYTDLPMARNVGADFILVLSGETKIEDLDESSEIPDLVIRDVGELPPLV